MSRDLPSQVLVAILNDQSTIMGCGFFVGPRQVVTCAHVVAQAWRQPGAAFLNQEALPQRPVTVRNSGGSYAATPILWRPVKPDLDDNTDQDDLAVLRLVQDAGMEVSEKLQTASPKPDEPCRICGFPAGANQGRWVHGTYSGPVMHGMEEIIKQGTHDDFIEEGFSGGPVWDVDHRVLHGMIRSVNGDRAQMMPVSAILRLLDQAGIFYPFLVPKPAPMPKTSLGSRIKAWFRLQLLPAADPGAILIAKKYENHFCRIDYDYLVNPIKTKLALTLQNTNRKPVVGILHGCQEHYLESLLKRLVLHDFRKEVAGFDNVRMDVEGGVEIHVDRKEPGVSLEDRLSHEINRMLDAWNQSGLAFPLENKVELCQSTLNKGGVPLLVSFHFNEDIMVHKEDIQVFDGLVAFWNKVAAASLSQPMVVMLCFHYKKRIASTPLGEHVHRLVRREISRESSDSSLILVPLESPRNLDHGHFRVWAKEFFKKFKEDEWPDTWLKRCMDAVWQEGETYSMWAFHDKIAPNFVVNLKRGKGS